MTRFLALPIALAALLPLAAQAALPPQYQRAREIQAALDVAVEALGIGSPVDSVTLVEPDHFVVTGGACAVDVHIVDTPGAHGEGWVGPREFKAVADEPVCD